MASTTPNIGLTLPTGTEGWKRSVINGNFTILDTKIGAVGNTPLQTQINTLSSHIAVLPSYTQCSNRSALETHLASVASGMTDNQIQTVYIVTGATFGFDVFGSGERYVGELKRMTSTQFVCRLASRLGDSIDIGYYEGTYAYNKLLPSFVMVEETKTTGATGNIATGYQASNKIVVCGAIALNADCYLRAWRSTGNGEWYLTAVNPNTGATVNSTSLNIRYLVITLK